MSRRPALSRPSAAPLEAGAEDFLTWLAVEKGRSANTLDAYRRDLCRYREHLRRRGRTVLDADHDDVVAFVHVLVGEGLAPSSVTRTLVAVRGLHRFLVAEELRADDPAVEVEMPQVPRGLPKALPLEQVTALIESVTGDDEVARRDRAILETLYATGIRAGELSNLTPYDVDTEERVLRVVRGKGGKDRSVPLTRPAAVAIEAYLASSRPQLALFRELEAKPLFLGNYGGKLKSARLSLIIRHWTAKAGVKKRVTCHTFRHSVATQLLRGRADIRHIQALLGHASLGTTERYTRVEIQDLRKVVRRAHPRGR